MLKNRNLFSNFLEVAAEPIRAHDELAVAGVVGHDERVPDVRQQPQRVVVQRHCGFKRDL